MGGWLAVWLAGLTPRRRRRLRGGGELPLHRVAAAVLRTQPASCLACRMACAAARPAGPPPATRTSTLIVCLRSALM